MRRCLALLLPLLAFAHRVDAQTRPLGGYAIVDSTGRVVIQNEGLVLPISEGYALVKDKATNFWGYKGVDNRWLGGKPEFLGGFAFWQGKAIVNYDNTWILMDAQGTPLKKLGLFRIGSAVHDLALVEEPGYGVFSGSRKGDGHGVLRLDGEIVLEPNDGIIVSIADGVIVRREQKGMFYYSLAGKKLAGPFDPGPTDKVFEVNAFRDGRGLAWDPKLEKFGYLDRTGRWAIAPAFPYGSAFVDGRAVVEGDGEDQLIDTTGAVVARFKGTSCASMPRQRAVFVRYGRDSVVTFDVDGRRLGRLPGTGKCYLNSPYAFGRMYYSPAAADTVVMAPLIRGIGPTANDTVLSTRAVQRVATLLHSTRGYARFALYEAPPAPARALPPGYASVDGRTFALATDRGEAYVMPLILQDPSTARDQGWIATLMVKVAPGASPPSEAELLDAAACQMPPNATQRVNQPLLGPFDSRLAVNQYQILYWQRFNGSRVPNTLAALTCQATYFFKR